LEKSERRNNAAVQDHKHAGWMIFAYMPSL